MTIEFLPEADREFREAVQYYEEKALGVGMTFITEVHRAIASIERNPYVVPDVKQGIRKKVLSHYPYNILYSIEAGSIVIVAVAHHKRRPKYWHKRIKQLKNRKD